MARCKGVYEFPDRKTGKPIRCKKNARREHEYCKNGQYEWKNTVGYVPKKKREKKTMVGSDDSPMVRAVGRYRDAKNKRVMGTHPDERGEK
jgi:hypothetical protein